MLGPHIFAGLPVISFIIAASSWQSFRFWGSSNLSINDLGLSAVSFVFAYAILVSFRNSNYTRAKPPLKEVNMRKITIPLAFAAAAAFITAVLMSMATSPVSFYAQARPVSGYAEDRAAIEDLQARYLFAL